jgi:hypothetical protein
MLSIIDKIRESEHEPSITVVAEAMGLEPYEAPTGKVLEELFTRIEREVAMYYEKCPIDRQFNPIHVGDITNFGSVHAIGDDSVVAGDSIYKDGFTCYPMYPALSCELTGTLEELLERIHYEYLKPGTTFESLANRYGQQLKAVVNRAG